MKHNVVVFITFLSLFLSSCAMDPPISKQSAVQKSVIAQKIRPTTPTVRAQDPNGTAHYPNGEAQYFLAGRNVSGEWWSLFHSKVVNKLIQQGIANNPTLEGARAALRGAQENLSAYRGNTQLPAIDVSGSASRQRPAAVSANGLSSSLFNLFNASVSVAYHFDIFGGTRKEIEALKAQVDYQRFLVEGTYLSLSANIASTAMTDAFLQSELATTHALITLNEEILQILKKQYQLGAGLQTDVLSQEGQLADLRALSTPLDLRLAQTRHALSLLLGEFPNTKRAHRLSVADLTLPTHLPISLPSAVIRQRPDVRASEALLKKASAEIGVATANLFPKLTLTGNYGSTATQTGTLFKGSNTVWAFGGQLLQPVFHGGALRAQRRAALAAHAYAEAQYRQTVLSAFQNVADSLRALQTDAAALKAYAASETAAKAALRLIQKQYKLGAVPYVSVLSVEKRYIQAKINRIQAEARRYTDTVALFQALGGGWWNRQR